MHLLLFPLLISDFVTLAFKNCASLLISNFVIPVSRICACASIHVSRMQVAGRSNFLSGRSPGVCDNAIVTNGSHFRLCLLFGFLSLASRIAVGFPFGLEPFLAQTLHGRMETPLEHLGPTASHRSKGPDHAVLHGPGQGAVPANSLGGSQAFVLALFDGHHGISDLINAVACCNESSDSFMGGKHELLSALSSDRVSREFVNFDTDDVFVLIIPIEGHRGTI